MKDLTIKQLKVVADERNIKYPSKIRKDDLIELILAEKEKAPKAKKGKSFKDEY